MSTKVFYFIADDGDDEAHPNMFSIPKSKTITLQDLRVNFPLKQHVYHFRFKRPFQNKHIWMDCLSDSQPLPLVDGVLFCKVTRVAANSGGSKPVAAVAPKKAAAATAATVSPPPQQQDGALFEWTEDEPAMVSPPAAAGNSSDADLFDIFSGSASVSPTPQVQQSNSNNASLMDFEWAPPPPKAGAGGNKILSTVEAAKNFQL